MSMKEDLTGEPIRLVADDVPDKIPEGMVEADGVVVPYDPDQKVLRVIDEDDSVTLKELEGSGGETNIPIKIGTHISLENIKHNLQTPLTSKGFMTRPNEDLFGPIGRFPSSRDWSMPTIECDSKNCAANYNGKCAMPSLIKIGANSKCKGNHPRVVKSKKAKSKKK